MVGMGETADMVEVPRSLADLSGPQLLRKQQIARVSTETLKYLTGKFASEGFEWLLPVVLSKSTDPLWPDPGASIEKRVETEVYGETVRTTLSMIIHKLVACSTAYPKLFVLSPNVRIERRERKSTGWHAYEFTQLDFEVRDAGFEDVRRLVEDVVVGLVDHLKERTRGELTSLGHYADLLPPSRPFRAFDRDSLIEKHGEDWERSLPQSISDPVWVTNIPREFYDFQDSESLKWDNYDLVVPGYGEVLSGARREWAHDKIRAKIERDGVRKENYTTLLKLASEHRLKPSAGAGLGIERLLCWVVRAKHLGEVQPFPRVPGVVDEL